MGVCKTCAESPHGMFTVTLGKRWKKIFTSQNLSKVTQKTRLLHEEPDKHMLAKLRILEKKMGLVLTLVSTT